MAAPDFLLSASLGPTDLHRIATIADRGGLDCLILEPPADTLIEASWLIPTTERVGLIVTLPATYAQPFHVARALSAMDILSGGRTGWLPAAAGHLKAAAAFGNLPALDMATALDKAAEFVAATEALWDSWDADALIIDKAAARYLDSGKIRRVDYRGAHFQVMGPLNAARPVQGYPVLALDDGDPLFDCLAHRAELALVGADSWDHARRRVEALRAGGAARILVKIRGGVGSAAGVAVTGAPAAVADALIAAWESTGCDGFHLDAAANIGPLLDALRLRGRKAGTGTLRQRLGLPVPVNPYAGAGA